MRRRRLSKTEKGFVLLAGGVMLMFMIPVVGLAVDAGFMYAVKARLSAATDAAALAAARSLVVGLTLAEQEQSARNRATAFFQANYPAGMFNTQSRNLAVDIRETGFRTRTVTVTGSVDSPLFFMRILNHSSSTVVAAEGRASRRDVNVMMVLDRSGSMNSNGGCTAMRDAANGFVNLFANQRDRLGMITYGISYSLTYAPALNFKSSSPTLQSRINSISCSGGTGTAQAFFKGYEQIVGIGEPGALNVILLFTDGIPNTVTGNFPVNVLDTVRVADAAGPPAGNSRSRCYDYQNGRRYNYVGANPQWGPTNQMVYRGAIYSQEGVPGGGDGLNGISGFTSTGFTDPGKVSRPYNSTSDTATQYAATGFENDCWFRGGAGAGTSDNWLQYDIAYYPDNDLYGTSLTSSDNYRVINHFDTTHPYANRIDVRDRRNMMYASINAVDNMGKRIRANDLRADLNTVVYAVGLGEAAEDQHTLLRRVSNDALSPIYDPNKLQGMYVYAPTAADLNSAFVRIASEVLRYTQ